jgi:TPR repeat protein
MLRRRTVSSLLLMSVFCASLALGQQKTVGQIIADAQHGDKSALQQLITMGDAENADAQFNLGLLYLDSKGVPKDAVQAANWFMKAAEQGISKAQFNLGVMYSNGDGVPKDHVQAAGWHRKAAERGQVNAQFVLGWMYADGDGVPKHNVQAYMWRNLAAAQGFKGAKTNRNTIEKMMTPAQIAEAQKLSREWKPTK